MIESSQPQFCQTDVTSWAVFQEDCVEVMKRYPNNYFDVAIVDPPYPGIAKAISEQWF